MTDFMAQTIYTSFHCLKAVQCGTMVIDNRTLAIYHIHKIVLNRRIFIVSVYFTIKRTLGQQKALSLMIRTHGYCIW
jgi:hypothetical protein